MNLMAHSWGALVALSYAIGYPENLKTLVLINPIAANDSLRSLAALNQSRRITREDSARLAEIMQSRSFQRRTPSALDRYFRTLFRSTLHDSRYADSLTLFFPKDYAVKSEKLKFLGKDLSAFDLYPRLRTISAPTLIIRGNDDPTPLNAVEMIRDSIPRATMKTIPLSGHFPFIEQREAFFNDVRQFLEERR